MTNVLSRQTVTVDPVCVQYYGGRSREYRLIGGVRVHDEASGDVWYECRYCDWFRSASPHGVSVHRGQVHKKRTRVSPGLRATEPAGPEPDDSAVRITRSDLSSELGKLIVRLQHAEADALAWRNRALNAESAAADLRQRLSGASS